MDVVPTGRERTLDEIITDVAGQLKDGEDGMFYTMIDGRSSPSP